MSTSPQPTSIGRLFQDHIDLRLALTAFEQEVDAVAQYHAPDPVLLGAAAQYFVRFPARCHHPIEDMVYEALKARAPDAAELAASVKQHGDLDTRAGDLALLTRNLFLETPKWRVPYCAAARSYIVLKREHIREEEKVLFRLARIHLADEDWRPIDAISQEVHARWTEDAAAARIVQALTLKNGG